MCNSNGSTIYYLFFASQKGTAENIVKYIFDKFGRIVGGESGPGARPIRKEWVVSIREPCKAAGVAFFFKQWGGTRKSLNGRKLEGRTYDEYRQRISAPARERAMCLSLADAFLKAFRPVQRQSLVPA